MSEEIKKTRRIIGDCRCSYQGEKAWGYNLMEWVGGRKSWNALGNGTHLEDVLQYAEDYPLILLRCNGCGKELVHDYPPAHSPKSTIPENN